MLNQKACRPHPHSKGIHNSSCPPPCSKGEKHDTNTESEFDWESQNNSIIKKVISKHDLLLCCCWVWLTYARQTGHRSEAHRNVYSQLCSTRGNLMLLLPVATCYEWMTNYFSSAFLMNLSHIFRENTGQVFVYLAGILTGPRAGKRLRGRTSCPSFNPSLTHL